MLDIILQKVKAFIPANVFSFFQPAYHWSLSLMAAVVYGFPSRKIRVIAVTGTKGKSSTVEIINAILEKAGHKTALSNTIRYKVGDTSHKNLFKMSMPGRLFMQKLIRDAVRDNCKYVIIEMTSQGALLYRHRFIHLDCLVFTNISPEHIEAHGSYEKYVEAKLSIATNMARSGKTTTLILNSDDPESKRFMAEHADNKIVYGLRDALPYDIKPSGLSFTWHGARASSKLSGIFNLYNILAAATTAAHEGVNDKDIVDAIDSFEFIPGRVEKIECGQDFTVVVDYAHTPDSLEKLYRVFRPDPRTPRTNRLIAVLGGTGGGRDNWKRKEMGRLADTYCDEIILTDEDPYDEDPNTIVSNVASGIVNKKATIIMDRRAAINHAIKSARKGDVILITGKGTDPYIMGPNGTKTSWSDADVCRDELRSVLNLK